VYSPYANHHIFSFHTDAVRRHQETYQQNSGNLSSNSLGSAAAMQALKKFTQGEGGNQSQGDFLGMAMAEASKVSYPTKRDEGIVIPL
jgi:hypothetical protein